MDITERTPLIQQELTNSHQSINIRYISKRWSKLLLLTSALDFIVHMAIYTFGFVNDTKNDFVRISSQLDILKYYDYLILSSIRITLLFSFCYIKKCSKLHLPVVVTFLTLVYITIDNYFNTIQNNFIHSLLIIFSFIFSWSELIIYIIAIFKYGSNYWYRISNQSFNFFYDNLNFQAQNERAFNLNENEQNERVSNLNENEQNDIRINVNENSDIILNENLNTDPSSNNNGNNFYDEGTSSTHKKHITIDSNFQFYSFSTKTKNKGKNNDISNDTFDYDDEKNNTLIDERPFKIIHRVSKSIDIKRKRNDSNLYKVCSEDGGSSAIKYNTLPNHLSLKSFSSFSPLLDENNFLGSNNKQDKSNKNETLCDKNGNKKENNKNYIDKELPIVLFENFKKDKNSKKYEEDEIRQNIINEIEQFYNHDLKNKIWTNDIEEAEEIIKSDINYKEKPYLLMHLIQICIIKFVLDCRMDFSLLLKLLKTAEKSIMDLLTKKCQKIYNKSYSISSLYNAQNGNSLSTSVNTSVSSLFSNITSFTNLADYDNDDDNQNIFQTENNLFSKDKFNYDYLFFKNCEVFYAEIILIRGFLENAIGKDIRGVIHIRKAWKLYNIFQNDSFMTKTGSNDKENYLLSSIKNNVMFGIGFANLFSFMLNKNSLQTINLNPNIDKGKKIFENLIDINEFKAPISALLLFINYIYFRKPKRAEKVCQSIKKHYSNSIIFSYLCNTCLLKQYGSSEISKEINVNSLFNCDQEKFIKFLGPYFNKKILNPFLNQNWEEVLKNLKEYSHFVAAKNIKPTKIKDYCMHMNNTENNINTPSLIPKNELCLYCFFQPFVTPITKIEQNIYKWCCLQMLLFVIKKELKAISENNNNESLERKDSKTNDNYYMSIDEDEDKNKNEDDNNDNDNVNDNNNNNNDDDDDDDDNDDKNDKNDKNNNNNNNNNDNNSINDINDNDNNNMELNSDFKIKQEKYKQLKEEFKIFNEIFINQCKEYKKYREDINNQNSSSNTNNIEISICCQLDPIFLYIASSIDNKNSKFPESSPLINIICILFVIHYASSSKLRNLLVKLFPTLNSNLYNTLMNPPAHIDTQYIMKCLNSF
ncbi:hypothetical protein BCR32DRAFT_290536 [Anaeromyces robustus]|uniref:Uncharacterized protein n=1 Tax=Anaeromyces robustus TaxID=1754192 RepID=A0A1Y1XIR2_9FUNG|nr:hypothetical protein BCR32DRAFT_290536 [Anaeromyces robustus]|eukprot:ORX85655.1 hypothetical protein BCR32DRAFT_290536 [Anaeromyces robustus]